MPFTRCTRLLAATASLPVTTLRGSRTTALPTTARRGAAPASALSPTGGKSTARSAAATGEAAASLRRATGASLSAPATTTTTSTSLRIDLADQAQHEQARNKSCPDPTP